MVRCSIDDLEQSLNLQIETLGDFYKNNINRSIANKQTACYKEQYQKISKAGILAFLEHISKESKDNRCGVIYIF